MMKKILVLAAIAVGICASSQVNAQDEKTAKEKDGYIFTEEVLVPHTSVKNQYRSGTCWCYSTLSFLESEILGETGDTVDLSEAFVIWHAYSEKAERYVRWHGSLNFGGGGAFHDPVEMIVENGIVPEEAFTGNVIGEDYFVHGEMDEVLKDYVDGVIENKNRTLTPVWHQGFNGILDAYIGDISAVDSFTVDGVEYTPESYRDQLGIDFNNYVEITSYTHHPFYEPFILEVEDNWVLGEVYNVPLNEMMEVIDYSLDNGHTIAWGADVSEKGFSWRNGVAIVPATDKSDITGSEQERWEKMTPAERKAQAFAFEGPVVEKTITQEMRQEGFDNYSTTDDHGMEIVGRASDQNGNIYYIIKNSWGTTGTYEGYFYASKAFVELKTMDIMINKVAIPKKIAKKLEL